MLPVNEILFVVCDVCVFILYLFFNKSFLLHEIPNLSDRGTATSLKSEAACSNCKPVVEVAGEEARFFSKSPFYICICDVMEVTSFQQADGFPRIVATQ